MPSMAFAKSTQARLPLFPAHAGSLHDAADFASRCGPASCSTPLRPRPLNRTRELRYRGPWRLPGPDSGCRELVARLRHDRSFAFMTSELLDARGSRLTVLISGNRRQHRHLL